MASQCHQGVDDHHTSRPIHFFKVILPHSLYEEKLRLPGKFVKKYGEGLPNTLFLKLPSGADWKVNLTKCNGEIWFQKGWKDFAEHHSLAEGHFLIFRYERSSHFQVLIFDMSGLEIDYPSRRVKRKEASNNQGNKASTVENLQEFQYQTTKTENCEACGSHQKRKDDSSRASLRPCKMRRTSGRNTVETTSDLAKADILHSKRKSNEGSRGVSDPEFLKSKVGMKLQPAMPSATRKSALDRASEFESCNPFFIIVMRPSYIDCTASVHIPSKFVERHLNLDKKRGSLNLQLLNGRVWPTRYIIRKVNTTIKAELSTGWKAFSKDNNLKVGDVCVFEHITRSKIAFQVSIFRDFDICPLSQDETGKLEQLKEGNSNIDLKAKSSSFSDLESNEAAKEFKSEYPFFKVVIRLANIQKNFLRVPIDSMKTYIKPGEQIVTLRVGIQSWRIKLISYPKIFKGMLSAGWPAFAKDNALEVGDVCFFEWLRPNSDDIVMKVSIFKQSSVKSS